VGEPELSAAEARRIALTAQGLYGAEARRGGVDAVLRRLAAIQLDTISVLARSHELVAYARLGAVGRDAVERALWGNGETFEYWAHAACVLPVAQWPLFAIRRRRYRERGVRWHERPGEHVERRILERLREEGPLTSTDLGGAKRGGPWWDWSEVKVGVEWLLDVGEVVCTSRRGWRRVYDLPERALPDAVRAAPEPDDASCLRALAEIAAGALGIATAADLAEFHRFGRQEVAAVLRDTELVPVKVDGWRDAAWAHPRALSGLASRGRHRTTLLSPFDSLVWDRPRTLRMFGFAHLLEAYKPAPTRVHGYYAMPLLAGGRLVGRVDPGRDGGALLAKRVGLAGAGAVEPAAAALREAASWVAAGGVVLGVVDPPELATPLARALANR
jgi:uncharacterized protein YcaQ